MPEHNSPSDVAGLSALVSFVVTGASQRVVEPNPARIGLLLGEPEAGVLTYSTNLITLAGQGLNLATGSGSIMLTRKKHGSIVTLGWSVFGSVGGGDAAIVEVFKRDRIEEPHASQHQ